MKGNDWTDRLKMLEWRGMTQQIDWRCWSEGKWLYRYTAHVGVKGNEWTDRLAGKAIITCQVVRRPEMLIVEELGTLPTGTKQRTTFKRVFKSFGKPEWSIPVLRSFPNCRPQECFRADVIDMHCPPRPGSFSLLYDVDGVVPLTLFPQLVSQAL